MIKSQTFSQLNHPGAPVIFLIMNLSGKIFIGSGGTNDVQIFIQRSRVLELDSLYYFQSLAIPNLLDGQNSFTLGIPTWNLVTLKEEMFSTFKIFWSLYSKFCHNNLNATLSNAFIHTEVQLMMSALLCVWISSHFDSISLQMSFVASRCWL